MAVIATSGDFFEAEFRDNVELGLFGEYKIQIFFPEWVLFTEYKKDWFSQIIQKQIKEFTASRKYREHFDIPSALTNDRFRCECMESALADFLVNFIRENYYKNVSLIVEVKRLPRILPEEYGMQEAHGELLRK